MLHLGDSYHWVYIILRKKVQLKNGIHFKMDPPYYVFGALDFFPGAFPHFQMGPPHYYYFGALDLSKEKSIELGETR